MTRPDVSGPVTLRAINAFVRVAEAKSFAAAARSLLLDPAAVSRSVKLLEQRLGVMLFARSTHVVKLTPEGVQFHRDCVQILAKLDEATQRFHVPGATARGRLTVGMSPALTRRMLLRALPSFRQAHPDVEIVLLGVNQPAERHDEAVDVLIRARSLRQRGGSHPEPEGLVVRKLFQSRFVACASPAYLSHAGPLRAPVDLLQHACIAFLTLEHDIQDEWTFVRAQTRQKVKIAPKLVIQGSDATREAALAGYGVIRLLACHVEDELRSRTLVPVLPEWECSGGPPIVAIYRKTKPPSPQIDAFVRFLEQAFRRYNS